MGIFGRLFGKRDKPAPVAARASESPPADEMIRVYDAYGREILITKQEWRDKVLIGNLNNARENPDELYNLIVGALQDGFASEAVSHAEHLQRIDPIPSRGATILGIAYLQLGRLDDAERIFKQYMGQHGEEGVVLTNLAKVYSGRGEIAKAEETLWRALELDPNQDNGLLWYASIAREKGGADCWLQATERVANLPLSWRAQVWLARSALERGDKTTALELYEKALSRCPRPVPADLLMQITGDLGNHGHLVELLKTANPHFDVSLHGLEVGNNLIKANLDLGRLDHSRAIVDQMYALNRPDYQQTLSYWETEIAKARTAANSDVGSVQQRFTLLAIHGPVWLKDSPLTASLVPPKGDNAVVTCFLGASADKAGPSEPQLQMPDAEGRLSRALPLFLCEQAHLRTSCIGEVLQPYLLGAGFVLSGKAWENEFGIDQARQQTPQGDYVVISHIIVRSNRSEVSFRFVRTIDGAVLDTISVPLDLNRPATAFLKLAERLLSLLRSKAQVDTADSSDWYQLPNEESLDDYLLRIEQALAVRACSFDGTRREFLSGERDILLGNLQLCLQNPRNITTRILFVRTLELMKAVVPQATSEFADRVRLLQTDHPLPGSAQTFLDEMLAPVLSN